MYFGPDGSMTWFVKGVQHFPPGTVPKKGEPPESVLTGEYQFTITIGADVVYGESLFHNLLDDPTTTQFFELGPKSSKFVQTKTLASGRSESETTKASDQNGKIVATLTKTVRGPNGKIISSKTTPLNSARDSRPANWVPIPRHNLFGGGGGGGGGGGKSGGDAGGIGRGPGPSGDSGSKGDDGGGDGPGGGGEGQDSGGEESGGRAPGAGGPGGETGSEGGIGGAPGGGRAPAGGTEGGGAGGIEGGESTDGGGCFAGDTRILMADGSAKNIAAISAGDVVLSYDQTANRCVAATVAVVMRHRLEPLLMVSLASGARMKVTSSHTVKSPSGWLPIRALTVGDDLMQLDSFSYQLEPVRISDIHAFDEALVFNLEVEGHHCFFAEGVLVHNLKENEAGGDPPRKILVN